MSATHSFFSSSVGRKAVMAVSGVLLIGFLLAHLLGNLLIFAGPDAMNSYAAMLKGSPKLLWTARIGLLAIFLAHVTTAIQLSRENAQARPVGYCYQNTVKATLASRTMALSGVLVLFYIIGHLLHFTLGVLYPEYFHLTDALGRHDVYGMVVHGFQNVFISAAYILAMIFIGMHLRHGIASFFQSLGLHHTRYTPMIRAIAPVVALVLALGYIAIPVSVLAGLITIPAGGV